MTCQARRTVTTRPEFAVGGTRIVAVFSSIYLSMNFRPATEDYEVDQKSDTGHEPDLLRHGRSVAKSF